MNQSNSYQNTRLMLGLCVPAIASCLILNSGMFTVQQANAKEAQFFQLAQQNNSPSATREKVRVAVLDFDFSSVSNLNLLSIFQGGSKGVSDILVNRLVKSGNFVVLERSQIDAILREQNLGNSGRVDGKFKVGDIAKPAQ